MSNELQNSVEQLSAFFIDAFPVMNNEDEQNISLALYRLLANGKPVSVAQVETTTGLSKETIEQVVQSWPGVFLNDEGKVYGYWGIATQEMPHRMSFDNQTSFAWCAWDTLFIPELLGETVDVVSACPVTGNSIELKVSPDHVESLNDKPLFVSFLTPDVEKLNEDVTTSFCHFVYFFDSKPVAEQWMVEHPDTFLLTLDEAFAIARTVNAGRYNNTLN